MEETVDGDWRRLYISHTTHTSSRNPSDYGALLNMSVDYHRENDSLHENVRGYSRVNDGKSGSRSQ